MAAVLLAAGFRSKLRVEDNDGFPFVLLEPLVYDSALLQRTIVVPAGFKTDYASIPRILWVALPPVGRYDKDAVVHDFLYQHNGVTRKQADDVLREAMEVSRVRRSQRDTIYAGVRVGGWWTWRKYRKADKRA
jgi:hypothetical protein